jgi:hypothetical protein
MFEPFFISPFVSKSNLTVFILFSIGSCIANNDQIKACFSKHLQLPQWLLPPLRHAK